MLSCVGYVAVLLGTFASLLANENGTWAAACVIIVAGTLLVMVNVIRSPQWKSQILFLVFSLGFAIGYPAAGIVTALYPERTLQWWASQDLEIWRTALLAGCLGWVCMSVGFHSPEILGLRRRDAASSASSNSFSGLIFLPISLIGLGSKTFVNLYYHSEQYRETYMNLGSFAGILGDLGLVTTLSLLRAPNRSWRAISLTIIFSAALTGMATGQRSGLSGILVMLLFFHIIGIEKISWKREGVRAAILVAAIAVSFSFLTTFKYAMTQARTTVSGLDRWTLAVDTLQQIADGTLRDVDESEEGLPGLVGRFSALQYGGLVIINAPEAFGYQYGATILEGFWMLIPRIVWEDKPLESLPVRLYRLQGFKGHGATEIPIAADWYFNFWWLGVIAGMFLTGLFYRFVNRYLISHPDPLTQGMFAVLLMDFMMVPQGIGGLITRFTITFCAVSVIRRITLVVTGEEAEAVNSKPPEVPSVAPGYIHGT